MATDVYELKIWYADADGKKSANILHFQDPSVTGAPNPYLVASQLLTGFQATALGPLTNCLADDCTLTVLQCRKINNGGGPTCEVIINQLGGAASPSYSNAIAANLTFIPNEGPYQRKEGHMFLGCVPTGALVGDIWQGFYEAVVATFTAALEAGITAGTETFKQVVVDRTTGAATGISQWLFRNVVSPLRRRLKPRY